MRHIGFQQEKWCRWWAREHMSCTTTASVKLFAAVRLTHGIVVQDRELQETAHRTDGSLELSDCFFAQSMLRKGKRGETLGRVVHFKLVHFLSYPMR
jgi:hypothetical protein